MDIYLALQLLYDTVLLLVCGYAAVCGERDERQAAGLILGCSAATAVVTALPAFTWQHGHIDVLVIDAVLFVGLGYIATVTQRFWPLWTAAFQTIDLTINILVIFVPAHHLRAYVILQGVWAYPILLTIALGVRTRQRSRRPANAASKNRQSRRNST